GLDSDRTVSSYTDLPSGDSSAAKPPSPVTWIASPPIVGIFHTCCSPVRAESKYIHRPSCDQLGLPSSAGCVVMRCGLPPFASITQMSNSPSAFESKAICPPFGDQRGVETA